MYKNNFVVVIKSKGKVLRENNSCVMLPFGTEYSILLKNLDSRQAVARVDVDGDNVLDGSRIIVPGNSTVELKGKMRGSTIRHRFKFIKKTREISEYRGDRPDDGLVRVEYWFEQETIQWVPPAVVTYYTPPTPMKCKGPSVWDGGQLTYGGIVHDSSTTASCNYVNSLLTSSPPGKAQLTSSPPGKDGITVQGSRTKQDFIHGSTGTLESNSSVLVIHLRGIGTKQKKVVKPITVKTRFRCSTCGRRSKSSAKWCSNCGTNLEM